MIQTKTYATLDSKNAMDFRSISTHMKADGHKMGPSRARLIMIGALEQIVKGIISKHSTTGMSEEEIHEVAIDPEFQNNIAPFIIQAFKEPETRI